MRLRWRAASGFVCSMASLKRGVPSDAPSVSSFFKPKIARMHSTTGASSLAPLSTKAPPFQKSDPTAESLAKSISESSGKAVTPHYVTTNCKSWYPLCRGYLPTPDKDSFEQQWQLHPPEYHQLKMFGKLVNESRWSQSWGASYRYSGAVNTERALGENPMVVDLIAAANSHVASFQPDMPYNGCLQNWYACMPILVSRVMVIPCAVSAGNSVPVCLFLPNL